MLIFARKLLTKSTISLVCQNSSRAFVSSKSLRSCNNKFEQALEHIEKYTNRKDDSNIGIVTLLVLGIYGRDLATATKPVESSYARLVTKYRTKMIGRCFKIEDKQIQNILVIDDTATATWESYEGKYCGVIRNPHIEDQLKTLSTATIVGNQGYITVASPFWNPDSITIYLNNHPSFTIENK